MIEVTNSGTSSSACSMLLRRWRVVSARNGRIGHRQPHLSRGMASSTTINLNNRTFRSTSNSSNGEVSSATTFNYHQDKNIVWAEYGGGSIVKGFLIATVQADQTLDARYEHVNVDGELMTGRCKSTPEVLEDGRVRLREKWKWTSGDESEGKSVVEEVRE